MSTPHNYPIHRADQRYSFRFDDPVSPEEAPARIAETEARLDRMMTLRREAWDESQTEPEQYERRGALYAWEGAGAEIEYVRAIIERGW